jgi:regulator of sirC expression with transglutaminase-like and TPR domain
MRDALESAARARFARLLEQDPVPLDEAALAIAEEEYPDLDPGLYLTRLDDLAARVALRAAVPGRAAALLRALREVLHEEEGFRGNRNDYQDPRNSFLNEVLDRRLGIPITLSVVYLEVARRIGLRLEGVGFPGHFLVKYALASGAEVFIDPFHAGELLSLDECVARHRALSGGRPLDPRYLRGVSNRQILARMLGNLRRIWLERRDDVRLYAVLDRILLVSPGQLEALRDRGLAAARLGGASAARRDLEAYLAQAPAPPGDADEIRGVLDGLRGGRGVLN